MQHADDGNVIWLRCRRDGTESGGGTGARLRKGCGDGGALSFGIEVTPLIVAADTVVN
jgi:hypothetical protein